MGKITLKNNVAYAYGMRTIIMQCWNWPKRTGGEGSAAEMFEILPRDWSLWPIFTQKWASV